MGNALGRTEWLEEPWSGLIWGYDVDEAHSAPVDIDANNYPKFRWLHFSLVDQRACRWIAECDKLPLTVRELMLSTDEHPRALVDDDGIVACIIPDSSREFTGDQEDLTRAIHFALTPDLMITARRHPVRCADEVKRRFDSGVAPRDPAAALDLLLGSSLADVNARLTLLVQQALQMEDDLLDSDREPDTRAIRVLRRRAVRIRRQTSGLYRTLHRLEEDEALPSPLLPTIERLAQRIAATESDVVTLIEQERLLREEIDVRATQRLNQNLYLLSVLTALMLPPTLIAGIFGMNTGGLPFQSTAHGTLVACLLALGSAIATYFFLRRIGFFRNGS